MESDRNTILLVEDDERLATLIQNYLQKHDSFDVACESRGDRAVERILAEQPDLVILDLMLPGLDGFGVCRSVRTEYKGPVLIMTAREDDMDQVAGLEMGADDYVKKPIEPRVLLARIRALLRRTTIDTQSTPPETEADELTYGGLKISRAAHTVTLHGNPITLTTNEFDLLWFLASNPGVIMDRDTLFNSLRGIDYDGLDRTVDVHISHLRKKLGDLSSPPTRIKTVWSKGYLFVENSWDE